MIITREYLRANPTHIFVFGDNLDRTGYGGAAFLRDEPNTYGFITKKHPNNKDDSFYRLLEYLPVFHTELLKLELIIINGIGFRTYLISKLGSGLANKYKIYEQIIWPSLPVLLKYPNVELL